MRHMGRLLVGLARYAEAEQHLLAAQATSGRAPNGDGERTTRIVKLLIDLYEAWGRPDKAAKWRRKLPPG